MNAVVAQWFGFVPAGVAMACWKCLGPLNPEEPLPEHTKVRVDLGVLCLKCETDGDA